MKKEGIKEFDNQIKEKVEILEDLDEMNEVQRYLRLAILLIFSGEDYEKFRKLDKKYNIERTKQLFQNWLKPI